MYKYCLVPKCKNTSIKTPEKLFFNVPKDPKLRKKWCSIIKLANKTPLSIKSTKHCCEDHFDIEEDMENYVKFKLVGGKLKLKKGVLPHKFDCQKPPKKIINRTGFKKRQDIEYFERVLSKDIGHEDLLLHSIEVVEYKNEDLDITQNSDPLYIPEEIAILSKNKEKSKETQAVQVKIKNEIKSTNTSPMWIKQLSHPKKNYPQSFTDNIITPSPDDVRQNLPIVSRKSFSKPFAIIDCFEIQIEKPSNATHQTLTWSQYKSCNTIKYMVSITPDGLISFVSDGYGGRIPDSIIFENSGFLDKLAEGSIILANKGFKKISHLLKQRGCSLLRPSVSFNSKPTKQEVLQTKRIAAIRIHVERSIEKLRDFKMIGPNACVDILNIKFLDHIVTIACGLVNLQDCLF